VRPLNELDSGVEWARNGAGLFYSRSFGFGLLDAAEAVRKAKRWRNVVRQQRCKWEAELDPSLIVKPQEKQGSEIMAACNVKKVEHVLVEFSGKAKKRGDFELTLVSPSGTESVILPTRK